MQKLMRIMAVALTLLLLGFILSFPLQMVFFALLGIMIPELDFRTKKYNHKIFHNIWFLVVIAITAIELGVSKTPLAMFSIGFLSHLVSDALTKDGIEPLWPIKKAKFNGPIKNGSIWEYILILAMLMMVYLVGRTV
jgi:membrane-bound metal-dependent hydrolase YbcI (DUF457 family)